MFGPIKYNDMHHMVIVFVYYPMRSGNISLSYIIPHIMYTDINSLAPVDSGEIQNNLTSHIYTLK